MAELANYPRDRPDQPESAAPPDAPNYLVASDLHLTLRRDETDAATDSSFAAFLQHYVEHRDGDRPWCLVLAGDTFDFVYPDMALFLERYATDPQAPRLDATSLEGAVPCSEDEPPADLDPRDPAAERQEAVGHRSLG